MLKTKTNYPPGKMENAQKSREISKECRICDMNTHLREGNSAWKSRLIRGVTSDIAKIRATISLPCHLPRHSAPL